MSKNAVELDPTDLKILDALQKNARLTNAELAEQVGLSLSPCWRRLKRLEEAGVIEGYRAVLNRKVLGLGVTAFVRIDIERHTPVFERKFEEAIAELPEVISCHVISGEGAFLLVVVCDSLETYSNFALNTLMALPGVKDTQTSFSLKEVKSSSMLPLGKR
ncbi:MAG TPA: Lrp/AsnC family transcriptional regulator [Burkholderiales bacterium]|jgi:Lrp/AsnC family leucine-responsive transcriptional regulator|nr:Lrp/AsnC family transcriptional regulator [Burkholderiales bacterium]